VAIAPVVRLNQTFVQTWAILCGTVRSGNWLFLWISRKSGFQQPEAITCFEN
jgi:hypothetical protein